ncbi:MAG: hydroxylamine reductase [Eubacteriales bacterium]|nr:hydroxylamine reductase [Eubacteriales bacterium]
MDTTMFCYQCEQTVPEKGCAMKKGVCGKDATTSNRQDDLTRALIALAKAAGGKSAGPAEDLLVLEGLFTTITNVNFDAETVEDMARRVMDAAGKLGYRAKELRLPWEDGDKDVASLKALVLLGIRGTAAYAHHAWVLGFKDPAVIDFLYEALAALGRGGTLASWLKMVDRAGEMNLRCMALLDKANTDSYGTPTPVEVPLRIEKGPFIVISGHDLRDLKLLLEQTAGRGVNVYTHGEMLPAHGYPELKKHAHLKGNFGTAWQNQQKEFMDLPAPVLFTTNCIMPVKGNYADRIFTTAVVRYPGLKHIGEDKDFTPLIDKALALGGYPEERAMAGINGGATVMTGFAHGAVLGLAPAIIDAVKAGEISHFFLVGGCDGAKPGRNYYTDFAKATPKDSIILTVACGKFRFNDLDLGTLKGLPRILDMGQCNDSYSAIRVALALAEAFGCGINGLPLSIVLSWYEQKAVWVLLTLLHLGIKNILLGPTLPLFISPNVLKVLVDNYNIGPISTPRADLEKLLAK